MKSAMVISGHHQMFAEKAREFVHYLKRSCGLRYVADIDGWDRSPDEMASVIGFHAIRAARQPFLLVYIGHGWDDGWYFAKWNKKKWLELKFSRLAAILKEREGPTLVVGDTCRAASLESHVTWRLDGLKPVGLISATSPKGCAYGQLSGDVLAAWRKRDLYLPQRREVYGRAFLERRRGAALDHHFFPKP